MKIGIYSPYLDTFGGGEKYMLTIAEYLSQAHQVEFLLGTHLYDIDIQLVKEKFKLLHNLDLSKVSFVKAPIGQGSSFVTRLFSLQKYDYLFYLTDGSYFYSTAKNNIMHFQVPFPKPQSQSWWDKIKLSSWKLAIYNSNFTKDIIEKNWPQVKGRVIYPPVNIDAFKSLVKKKQIISVGRFAGHTRSKKHEVLIESFKKLAAKDWSLHLVGNANTGDKTYVDELKVLAKGEQIFFYENLGLPDLSKLYGESSIYWHAAGFGEDDPTKMEHFGITTVEAMASGCVPVVIGKGGQLEIVRDGENGLLWQTQQELVERTLQLIKDSDMLKKLAENAISRSKLLSKENFCRNIEEIINARS